MAEALVCAGETVAGPWAWGAAQQVGHIILICENKTGSYLG